jgi:hypothetical protein
MDPVKVTNPILAVWENALLTFAKVLPAKDLKIIQLPIKPEELMVNLEDWKSNQDGQSNKLKILAEQSLVRLQRFSACIDVLAQGLPEPAILLWGSIKFVLKVHHDNYLMPYYISNNELPR